MRTGRRLLTGLCLALLWGGVGRASGPEEDPHVLLFEREGLRQRLNEVGAHVDAAVRAYGSGLTPGKAQALRQGLLKAFDRDALAADFLTQYRQEVGKGTLRLLLGFYDGSELGPRISQLDALAGAPGAAVDIDLLAAGLDGSIQDPNRLELLRRLDRATQATDTLVAEVTEACRAVASSIDALRPLHEQLGPKAIERHYFAYRAKLRETAAKRVLATLLYTYRPLPGRELGAYVQFRETSGARAYTGKATQIFYATLERASQRSASLVVEALNAQTLALAQAEAASREPAKGLRAATPSARQDSGPHPPPSARQPSQGGQPGLLPSPSRTRSPMPALPPPRGGASDAAMPPRTPRGIGAAPTIQLPGQPALGGVAGARRPSGE